MNITIIGNVYKRRADAWRAIRNLQKRQPKNVTEYGVFHDNGGYEVDAYTPIDKSTKKQEIR